MAGSRPEEKVPHPLLRQDWRDVTFLHWRYDPAVVAKLLPVPLRPDVRDGSAWVTLTPFRIERARLAMLPPVPGLSDFPETNVRTYALDPRNRDAIVFLTLEVDSLPTMIGARLGVGVPYRWAAMRVDRDNATVRYVSRRRSVDDVGHDITVSTGPRIAPEGLTELDHWLTGRWRSHARVAGKAAYVPVEHEPWPLHRAEVADLHETLLASVGLPLPDEPPLVHFSPGVDARLGPPRLHS